MKKHNKFLTKLIAIFMAVGMVLSVSIAAGCKDKYDPEALQISISKMGYGTEWLKDIIDAYEEKTGNKVQLTEEIGQEGDAKILTSIKSLESTVDLAFTEQNILEDIYTGEVIKGSTKYDCLFEELSDVYSSASDGKTIATKMDEKSLNYFNIDGKYYALPWQGGVSGIVRNNNAWKQLGFTDADTPLTTDQLFDVCDKIISKNAGVSPFIYSLESEYYTMFSPIWCAQYEGRENMNLFLSGRDPDGNITEYLYTYDGQVEGLKVLQKLIVTDGYQHSASTSLDFSDMQSYFLMGQAVFCVNGSWLEQEMSNYKDANISFIRVPVVSSIVDKAVSIKNAANFEGTTPDEMLALIIKEIDSGKTSSEHQGVTQEDFNIVKEARSISSLKSGTGAVVVIPSYSTKIDTAKEFLKFMYSDEGLNIYYKSLNGAVIPVKPATGYKTDEVTLSVFRQSINFLEENGYYHDHSTNIKMFNYAGVNKNFCNGSGRIVDEFLDGTSVSEILGNNTTYIRGRWSNIIKYL